MDSPIVDIHPHVISANQVRYPATPLGGKQSTWSRERPIDFEKLVSEMDKSGVDKAVIVHSSTTYGFDNSYVVDSIAEHTDRFAAVVSVNLRAKNANEMIDYWLGKPGVAGFRIFTKGSTLPGQAFPLDDPETYDAWKHLEELRVPVAVTLTFGALDQLRTLMDRFPQAIMILDHMGRPQAEDGPPYERARPLFDLASYEGLYLKYSPRVVEETGKGLGTPESFMRELVNHFGANKVAWGSNYPANAGSLGDLLKMSLAALTELSEEEQAQVMGGTAVDLYLRRRATVGSAV